jgi:hypothetical protein
VVHPATTSPRAPARRHLTTRALKGSQSSVAAMSRIDVENEKTATGSYRYVGVRYALPPMRHALFVIAGV